MGGLNVKNTIVERVLQSMAPHPCFGCGKVGVLLCDNCKYDIIHEPFLGCILCGAPQRYGVCTHHDTSLGRAFTVGQRGGVLEALINALKFSRVKAAATVLAELLDASLPLLPDDCIVAIIPTVRSHVRQRGYDHIDLVGRQFAQRRGTKVYPLLRRVTRATQHTSTKEERIAQAAQAFILEAKQELRGKTVLLLDDIVTTGSTLQSAARILSSAGATVWVATLAYQPLD